MADDVRFDNVPQILSPTEQAVAAEVDVILHQIDPVDRAQCLLERAAVLHLADQHLGQELPVATSGVQEGLRRVREHFRGQLIEDLLHQRCRGEDFGGRFDAQLVPLDPAHVGVVPGVGDDFGERWFHITHGTGKEGGCQAFVSMYSISSGVNSK